MFNFSSQSLFIAEKKKFVGKKKKAFSPMWVVEKIFLHFFLRLLDVLILMVCSKIHRKIRAVLHEKSKKVHAAWETPKTRLQNFSVNQRLIR